MEENNKPLPICGFYDRQRVAQFSPEDAANWFLVKNARAKKGLAMYPAMGRRHVSYLGSNRLIFDSEPRGEFKSIKFGYVVVSGSIFKIDQFFNVVDISQGKLTTISGDVYFTYLVTPDITFACFVDGQHIYIYREDTGSFDIVTDPNAPQRPKFIVAFGNRLAACNQDSSQFNLSEINLDDVAFNPATCFTVSGQAVFAQESGLIRQFGVIHNTLYIFTDYTTGIWANIPSTFTSTGGDQTSFPWKKSSTYDWDYGMADPQSLDIDFDRMVWLARSRNGLIQVVKSTGDKPQVISTKAIDVLFQRKASKNKLSPFIEFTANGFLYSYENTVFYRLSAGPYLDYKVLDFGDSANSIEYNFDTESWSRCIELNGERNRIKKHIYFEERHLVTVVGETAIYEMSGDFFTNENRNPLQPDPQASDAFLEYPFRYERISTIIAEDDDSEYITDWVQIDFVWGDGSLYSTSPFPNAVFLIDEEPDTNGDPVYLIAEDSPTTPPDPTFLLAEEGNQPTINETFYNALFKPHVELYYSDDGGVSFLPADVRRFSDKGQYQWRMRWYQLGPSRNRVYKLICVSPTPIYVLGGTMSVRPSSEGTS